ncbi:MAG: hypothetical protein V5804_01375 [Mucilaginibacter sp.]|uniref:hypothetical protein n=1 Tax=Mucilaginibacter sp. TaxID=1882438 RepID=UPI0034E4C73C
MIREEKDIDFYTTGRQPSKLEFAKISEWIKNDTAKQNLNSKKAQQRKNNPANISTVASALDLVQH